jgi:hypothetical protein
MAPAAQLGQSASMDQMEHGPAAAIILNESLSKAVYDYWNALRNGRPIPWRREIDPGQLRSWLPRIALLEQAGPQHTIFRLAGTSICAAFGRELRDHAMASLWRGPDRTAVEAALEATLTERKAFLVRFQALALERRPLAGEMALLPLLDDAGSPSRVMASFAIEPDAQRLASKPFLRLQLLETISIVPDRDRVTLAQTAVSPLRPALALVENVTRPNPADSPQTPTVMQPWSRLVRDLLRSED